MLTCVVGYMLRIVQITGIYYEKLIFNLSNITDIG